MSSYLDFVVESKQKDGSWRNFYQTTYDEKTDVINQYPLKSLFWDTDHFSGMADYLNDLTDKSKCMFGEKIREVHPFKNKNNLFAKYEKEEYEKDSYPYKYLMTTKNEGMSRQFHGVEFKEYILNYLEHLMETSETRFNKTWIEVNPDGLKKHFETFSPYFSLNIDELEDYEKARNDLINNPDKIFSCFNLMNDLHFTNIIETAEAGVSVYAWCMDTPYEWIEAIKYQPAFKDATVLEELFGNWFGQVIYKNSQKMCVVPQFEIGDAKVSYKADVEAMLEEVKRELAEAEHSREGDNTAKAKVKAFLEDYEDNSETELYKALSEWVGDAEDVASLEYIDELKEQILQLTNLNAIMHEEDRLIWGIS